MKPYKYNCKDFIGRNEVNERNSVWNAEQNSGEERTQGQRNRQAYAQEKERDLTQRRRQVQEQGIDQTQAQACGQLQGSQQSPTQEQNQAQLQQQAEKGKKKLRKTINFRAFLLPFDRLSNGVLTEKRTFHYWGTCNFYNERK